MYLNNLQFKKKKKKADTDTCLSLPGCDVKLTPASSGGRSKPARAKGREEGNHTTSQAQATQPPGEETAKTELTKDISQQPALLNQTELPPAVSSHVISAENLNDWSIF